MPVSAKDERNHANILCKLHIPPCNFIKNSAFTACSNCVKNNTQLSMLLFLYFSRCLVRNNAPGTTESPRRYWRAGDAKSRQMVSMFMLTGKVVLIIGSARGD